MNLAWTTQKIAKILNLPEPKDFAITEITTDSRAVKPGSLFVAIKGDTHDGHAFIDQAKKSGAIAILSEQNGSHDSGVFFKVPSTMDAIRAIAHDYRSGFNIPIIGVVGAVGKTTTKELASALLQGKFKSVLKTEGSQNGYLGIPLTLLKLTGETDIAVIEIGIDEIGAMKKHVELVRPTHTILTKIGPEHLHQLKTVEIAASEELIAFDDAFTRKIPVALNLSDPYVKTWFEKRPTLKGSPLCHTYSLDPNDKPDTLGTFLINTESLDVIENSNAGKMNASFSCPLPGVHHAHNLLAAITLCRFFGLTSEELNKGLSTFKTAQGRTEIYNLESGITVIGDHYNSNPTSLEAALSLLESVPEKVQYHAVLGDMLELGDGEEAFHRNIAKLLTPSRITHLWLYGPRMKWLKDELKQESPAHHQHFETHEALLSALKAILKPNARILVKGSRGMKMEKILNPLIGKTQA